MDQRVKWLTNCFYVEMIRGFGARDPSISQVSGEFATVGADRSVLHGISCAPGPAIPLSGYLPPEGAVPIAIPVPPTTLEVGTASTRPPTRFVEFAGPEGFFTSEIWRRQIVGNCCI
jgi:hypothetical protein